MAEEIKKSSGYDDNSDSKIEKIIDEYIQKFFSGIDDEVIKIRNNIWSIREPYYTFNIIITSLLVIFDAILFDKLPKAKLEFFEELLSLNAHYAKSSKLCLVKEEIHLRIIRGLEDFDYSEFKAHVEEYREIFPEIFKKLSGNFYVKSETETEESEESVKDAE